MYKHKRRIMNELEETETIAELNEPQLTLEYGIERSVVMKMIPTTPNHTFVTKITKMDFSAYTKNLFCRLYGL